MTTRNISGVAQQLPRYEMPVGQTPSSLSGGSVSPAITSSSPTDFWNQLVKANLIQGDAGYYSDRKADTSEYTNAYKVALGNADQTQRRGIIDYLFSQGIAEGDPTYWYRDRPDEMGSIYDAITKYYSPQMGTSSTATIAPGGPAAIIPGVVQPGPVDQGAITGATQAPNTAQGPDEFWQAMVDQGLIQGDPAYYSNQQGYQPEYVHAIRTALSAADGDQRRQIVDYLFDSGAASGDRRYWYTPRGAEDEDLIASAAQLSSNTIGYDSEDPNQDASISPELDRLRNERLAAALDAINAQFNMQQGGLEGDIRSLLGQFQTEMNTSERNQGLALEQALANAEARGIYNSGITAQNVTRATTPFQEEQANIMARLNPEAGAEGYEVRRIQSALELLDQQRAQAVAQARIDKEISELELEQMIAMMNAGLTG